MKIAIPSYNRSKLCITHNLFPTHPVSVVVPESQLQNYIENLTNEYVISIPDKQDGNIAKKRNAILDKYEWEDIVMLDDDMLSFMRLTPQWVISDPMSEDEILSFFTNAFKSMERVGYYVGWVYPVANKFFMAHKIHHHAFIIGTVMFFRKWHGLRFDEACTAKEDYDITCKAISVHWGVCRFDDKCFKKKDYKGKGGVAQQREESNIDEQATIYLTQKRPQLLKRNPKRRNEILIKHSLW